MSTPLLEWELTEREWKDRYGSHILRSLPLTILMSIPLSLYLFFDEDLSSIGKVMIFVFFLTTFILFSYINYLGYPKKVRFFNDHVEITAKGKTSIYPWTQFVGYITHSDIFATMEGKHSEEFKEIGEHQTETVGKSYYLLRSTFWENINAYHGSVLIHTEPGIQAEANKIIRSKLSRLSAHKIQGTVNRTITIATFIVLGFLFYLMIIFVK